MVRATSHGGWQTVRWKLIQKLTGVGVEKHRQHCAECQGEGCREEGAPQCFRGEQGSTTRLHAKAGRRKTRLKAQMHRGRLRSDAPTWHQHAESGRASQAGHRGGQLRLVQRGNASQRYLRRGKAKVGMALRKLSARGAAWRAEACNRSASGVMPWHFGATKPSAVYQPTQVCYVLSPRSCLPIQPHLFGRLLPRRFFVVHLLGRLQPPPRRPPPPRHVAPDAAHAALQCIEAGHAGCAKRLMRLCKQVAEQAAGGSIFPWPSLGVSMPLRD